MASVNLKVLADKLDPLCRRSLETAAGMCMSRTNYNVEIEHWLMQLLEPAESDLHRIFNQYGIDARRVSRELTQSLEQLKTGNGRAPTLAPDLVALMREAWTEASLNYQVNRIGPGHVLLTLLSQEDLGLKVRVRCPELAKISSDRLRQDLPALSGGTGGEEAGAGTAGSAEAPGPDKTTGSRTPVLDQFTINLTERARKGEVDPVIGRDFEIRQVIDILTRRRQNNPILTGEAGVGKTAVVEGFALRIVAGDVPQPLKNVALRTLDLGLLQAGAGIKGEFENRLKGVIAEVKASPQPIILFIDEAHTIIGAGGAAGQGDAANLLKPALARGELRTIAATTWNEYKKFFETDAALKRRFQVVKVDEPNETKAVQMMRGLTATLEKHHKVRILDEAVEDAVKLSHRYITDRQLPDKSVSLLDTACARVSLSLAARPPALEDVQRSIEYLQVEIGILEREQAVGAPHEQRLDEAGRLLSAAKERYAVLEKRWGDEKALVEQIHKLRGQLEEQLTTPADKRLGQAELDRSRADLGRLEQQLAVLQGESPLIHPVVDRQSVAAVVSGWTGIPVGKMVLDEIKTVLALKDKLQERIVGQDHALETIAQRIRTSRANLTDPRRPIGVFLLVGPSGVGKTETVLSLADILYGGDRNIVVINMSEYKEEHKISRLTGSAPGYVGYGEGGVLTEAVRRRPYSIVLLDEVEKANESVQEIFYQVFDKGTLQDDKGNEVDFKNTIIFLTANVGTDTIMKVCADQDTMPDAPALATALRPDLLKAFKPALLGRLSVVPYFPLSDEVLRLIIKLQLKKIGERVRQNYKAPFEYDEGLIGAIAGRCKEVETGARNVDHILTGSLLPEMSREFLARLAEGKQVGRVRISLGNQGEFVYDIG